jgi:nucleotide-binding universal stress UspA family protein
MRILAAIDFSESSQAVIKQARKLAQALPAKIWLLHVAEPDPDFVGYRDDPEVMRDVVAKRYHTEHKQLQELAGQLRGASMDCVALLVQGTTADTILKEGTRLSVDMIVVGSHGKGAMKQLILGSTSEGVLRRATVPVFVVPTHHGT